MTLKAEIIACCQTAGMLVMSLYEHTMDNIEAAVQIAGHPLVSLNRYEYLYIVMGEHAGGFPGIALMAGRWAWAMDVHEELNARISTEEISRIQFIDTFTEDVLRRLSTEGVQAVPVTTGEASAIINELIQRQTVKKVDNETSA